MASAKVLGSQSMSRAKQWSSKRYLGVKHISMKGYNAGIKVYRTKAKWKELKRQIHNRSIKLKLINGKINIQYYSGKLDLNKLKGIKWTDKHHNLMKKIFEENPHISLQVAMEVVGHIELSGAVKKTSSKQSIDFYSYALKINSIAMFSKATMSEMTGKDKQMEGLQSRIKTSYLERNHEGAMRAIDQFNPFQLRLKNGELDVTFYKNAHFEAQVIKNNVLWESRYDVALDNLIVKYPTVEMKIIRQLLAQQVLFEGPQVNIQPVRYTIGLQNYIESRSTAFIE